MNIAAVGASVGRVGLATLFAHSVIIMAPQPTALSISSANSRARTQVRKKPNDDAPYIGQLGAGAKRQAVERADGEPRTKRKKLDALVGGNHRKGDADEHDGVVCIISCVAGSLSDSDA